MLILPQIVGIHIKPYANDIINASEKRAKKELKQKIKQEKEMEKVEETR